MSDLTDLESFQTHLQNTGIAPTLLDTSPDRTLTIADEGGRSRGDTSLHALPELRVGVGNNDDQPVDIEPIETLGEGGMGVVRLARQTVLEREVAVKTVRDQVDESVAESLLQEAYVTGYLEHPNIIPIHTVGCTEEGAPLIVMKRVEGKSWLERIDGEGSTDIVGDLEILIEVTNAVRFAHSRGIIHRDIKPENIMIGDFDEVYLLDWGIAVSLEDNKKLLPSVSEVPGLSGTPTYMAPEMAGEEQGRLDEQTDVYLLGATLHHMLTGQMRHRGQNVLQVLFAAHESEPYDYPDDVPAELASIANRACSRRKQDRFAGADAFRAALKDYLRHRESVQISASAREKFVELQELLDAEHCDSVAIHDTYGECRFGFDQALKMWPENTSARRGLQHTLEAMADYHLERDQLDAAESCLAQLPKSCPELSERFTELAHRLEEDEQELKRLKKLEDNLDLSKASTSRSLIVMVLGLLWTATSLYAAVSRDLEPWTHVEDLHHHMTSGVRNVGIAAALVYVFRKPLFSNSVNRRMVGMMMAMLTTMGFVRGGFWYLEASVFVGRLVEMAIIAVSLIGMGLMSDLRICFISLFFAAAAAVSLIWPEGQLYANTVAVAATFGAFAWLWSPRQVQKKMTV